MKNFFGRVIQLRYVMIPLFLISAVVCGYCRQFILVNYDMNDYLPKSSPSTIALETMNQEFEGAIPNARVMAKATDKNEALANKGELGSIDGVLSVTWLDDTTILDMPFEVYNKDTLEHYWKDGYALYTLTIDTEKQLEVIPALSKLIGEDGAMSGSAVTNAYATASTVSQIKKATIFSVIFLLVILVLTTNSWVEPFIILGGLGVAVVLNSGSNLIFGEISFVTNAAGNILQLAISLDYSVFLLHRFNECRQSGQSDPKEAMQEALFLSVKSILSSGLTTVIGFLALVMMQFRIGPDLGLALAKGIGISLLTVFLFMPALILVTYHWMDKTIHQSFMPSFKKMGQFVQKVMFPLGILFLFIVIPANRASNSNSYYYGSSHIFGEETTVGSDVQKIEEVFGKNDTYVLMLAKGNTKAERDVLDALEQIPEVASITALQNMIGTLTPTEIVPRVLLDKLQSEHYDRILLNVKADYEGEDTFALVEEIRSIAQQYYPNEWYLAGQGVSTYDLMDTVTVDTVKVNLLAIAAVFVVLLFTMKSLILPVILVLTIETSIWVNLSIPFITGKSLFYIAYLIISSIQLGATVDYAILFTERYRENRQILNPRDSVSKTISDVTTSILTSGLTLTSVGFMLGMLSSHGLLSQLGYLIGKGTLCAMIAVLFVLPCYLTVADSLFVKHKR